MQSVLTIYANIFLFFDALYTKFLYLFDCAGGFHWCHRQEDLPGEHLHGWGHTYDPHRVICCFPYKALHNKDIFTLIPYY